MGLLYIYIYIYIYIEVIIILIFIGIIICCWDYMMGSNLDIVGAIAGIQFRYYGSKPTKPLALKHC